MALKRKGSVTWVFEKDQLKRELLGIWDDALTEAAAEGADSARDMIVPRGFSDFVKAKLSKKALKSQPGRRSKPGESPTTQSNDLRKSIAHTKAKSLRAQIGTDVLHGKYLELGTSKMAPRPWLKRGVKKARGKMFRIFVRQSVRGMKRIRIRVEKTGR